MASWKKHGPGDLELTRSRSPRARAGRWDHRRHERAPAFERPPPGTGLEGAALDVIPSVAPPSLEDLVIDLDDAPAPTADDLVTRFEEHLFAASPRRERAVGEPLQLGDEVELSVVGYVGGRLLPFSAQRLGPIELAPWDHLPGLAEGVALGEVGQTFTVPIVLDEDYPVPALRGQPARFVVEVLAARAVDRLDEEDPQELARLGLGATLDEVMERVGAELEAEAGEALLVEARDAVLDALAARTALEVPDAAVDDEIERRWAAAEAPLLEERGFSSAEQDEALATWLADPPTRLAVLRHLKLLAALEAVAAAEGLTPDDDELGRLVAEAVAPGAPPPDDEALRTRWLPWARRRQAIEHVMARATVRFPEDR